MTPTVKDCHRHHNAYGTGKDVGADVTAKVEYKKKSVGCVLAHITIKATLEQLLFFFSP